MHEKLKNIKWYHLAIAAVIILFSPMIFLFVKPAVSMNIIAIPVDRPSLDAPISPVFSRCQYFIFYDLKRNEATYIVNQYLNTNHEVGMHVTHLVMREKAGIVIARTIGPEPFEHLTARGVEIYKSAAFSVRSAIMQYKTNLLERTNKPTGFFKQFF
ncbi:MAG: NifB/NifX family molybdenum-iron cluster-binding protein [Candidatus Omnitrophica bacterium]|nr:NifB/NifX family molybdenum-iron cluster-binding protein [Candidatus Omnitrophota bacterium]